MKKKLIAGAIAVAVCCIASYLTSDSFLTNMKQEREARLVRQVHENIEAQKALLPEAVLNAFLEEGKILLVEERTIEAILKEDVEDTIQTGLYDGYTKTIYITVCKQNIDSKVLLHEMSHYMDHVNGFTFKQNKEIAKQEYGKAAKNFRFFTCSSYKHHLGEVIDTYPAEYFAEAMAMYLTYPENAKELMPQTCEVLEQTILTFEDR